MISETVSVVTGRWWWQHAANGREQVGDGDKDIMCGRLWGQAPVGVSFTSVHYCSVQYLQFCWCLCRNHTWKWLIHFCKRTNNVLLDFLMKYRQVLYIVALADNITATTYCLCSLTVHYNFFPFSSRFRSTKIYEFYTVFWRTCDHCYSSCVTHACCMAENVASAGRKWNVCHTETRMMCGVELKNNLSCVELNCC